MLPYMSKNTIYLLIGAAVVVLVVGFLLFRGGDEKLAEPNKELKILQWKHFVSAYDEWFDKYTKEWGEENGVRVVVDHVDIGDLNDAILSDLAAGGEYDLYEFISPPANLEPQLLDMRDINEKAEQQFGQQSPVCRKSSYNPTTDSFYGFCHGWVPDPGDYRKNLWELIGKPEGPQTWNDLLEFGTKIKNELGIGMGIGMSREVDSNMAARALLWAFGASVQDENEQVVINSPETVAAVQFMTRLYRSTMTDEVFEWDAASNNQALISARTSYILNSISAYRTAQKTIKQVADDIFFVPALEGPTGRAFVGPHVIFIYSIPKSSENVDIAEAFIMDLVANYDKAVLASELYNFPAFVSTTPDLFRDGGWLDEDPIDSNPPDKLAPLKNAGEWTVNLGYPGPANAAVGEVLNSFILPDMFAKAARGEMSAREAVAEAEGLIEEIFSKWRDQGLVGR